jgi:hypothetical protein
MTCGGRVWTAFSLRHARKQRCIKLRKRLSALQSNDVLGGAGTGRSKDAQDIPCVLPLLQSGFADGMVVGVIVLRAVAAVSV